MNSDASRYVAVCRGFGLSEREIREADCDDESAGTPFDADSVPERHEQLLATLAGSDRGVDRSGDASGRAVAAGVRTALQAAGLDEAASAIADAEGVLFDRIAAVECAVLDGTYRVVRLDDTSRWRFVVVESRRLAGVREQFGHRVELEGVPTLHADQPADRSVDPAAHLPPTYRRSESRLPPPGGDPERFVSDPNVDEISAAIAEGATDDGDPSPLEGATVRGALDAPPPEPAGPALDEPAVRAPGDVEEEPVVAPGRVERGGDEPVVAPGRVEPDEAVTDRPVALDAPKRRPALDAAPSEPAGPALVEPPIVARGDVEEEPVVAPGVVEEEPVVAPGTVDPSDGNDDDADG